MSDYTITETGYGQYQVVDNRSSGSDGTDSLTSIETLRFADQDIDIMKCGQTLTGTSSADDITGQWDDDIDGLGGNDTLDRNPEGYDEKGGEGDDKLVLMAYLLT